MTETRPVEIREHLQCDVKLAPGAETTFYASVGEDELERLRELTRRGRKVKAGNGPMRITAVRHEPNVLDEDRSTVRVELELIGTI